MQRDCFAPLWLLGSFSYLESDSIPRPSITVLCWLNSAAHTPSSSERQHANYSVPVLVRDKPARLCLQSVFGPVSREVLEWVLTASGSGAGRHHSHQVEGDPCFSRPLQQSLRTAPWTRELGSVCFVGKLGLSEEPGSAVASLSFPGELSRSAVLLSSNLTLLLCLCGLAVFVVEWTLPFCAPDFDSWRRPLSAPAFFHSPDCFRHSFAHRLVSYTLFFFSVYICIFSNQNLIFSMSVCT